MSGLEQSGSWALLTLNELGTLQRGRSRHRPRYAFHLYGGHYPFIQTGEIREARKYVRKFEQTYSDAGLQQSRLWPKGTLCITIAANIAELAILGFDACFPDSVLGFLPDAAKANLDFVYYTLVHFQRELKHAGEGSVQDNINLGTFENRRFPIPKLPEQEGIAAILSSLDKKIDLLIRQNQILEAMAETLFRQWFEQDAATDWPEGVVEDLFVLQRGFDLPEQERRDGPHPVVSSSGVSGGHAEYKVEAPGVTTGRSGLIGKVFLVQDHYWPLNTSLYVKEFRRGSPLFSYFFLKAMDLSAFNAGSAVPTLNRNHVHAQRVPLPPRDLIERFDAVAWPLFHKIRHNERQAVQLETLRDTLLPKLMSGEVRVSF